MMKINFIAVLASFFCIVSCNNSNKRENFNWLATVTSAKGYPIEIHKGYFATEEKLITGFRNSGIEDDGWLYDGTDTGTGGNVIPTILSLTWMSYAEKKFWNIDTNIDQTTQNKILALFQKGFYNWDRVKKELKHETYDHITIAVAPGGIVVLFLTGNAHRTEIVRYQAKETFVDVNEFYDNPHEHTQQQFYDSLFLITVSKDLQKKINLSGIPYGIWDIYRERYNWRFKMFFHKEDQLTHYYIGYINGEEDNIYQEAIDKNIFNYTALPLTASFYFKVYNCEAKFEEDEIVAAFKKMKKNHPDKNIEVEVRPAFMYKTVQFTVKCEGEEIPLEKTIVKMWKN